MDLIKYLKPQKGNSKVISFRTANASLIRQIKKLARTNRISLGDTYELLLTIGLNIVKAQEKGER